MTKRKYQTARCILYRDNRFLLADHKGSPRSRSTRRRTQARSEGLVRWGLPGGHVEWGEEPIEAAHREVFEELNVTLGALQKVGDYSYKQRLHAIFAAPSDCEDFDLEFSELVQVRWFNAQEISHLKDFDQLHAGYEYDAVQTLCAMLAK